jgi:hypothetical protein
VPEAIVLLRLKRRIAWTCRTASRHGCVGDNT